ncbi:DUF6282 family protein [Thalassovita sp.]|jgi:hypothetical protein|uniref:DUF6282 family protein n=1 Tax=Thalassovita sp. TaxID=1979401 RepID=UPI003B5BBAD3
MNDMTDNSRAAEVAELLKGAIDLHCHSGPAAMPRILDHHEALLDAAEAGFRAVLYKDHFYLGVAHCVMLEKLVPDTGVNLYSGIALNNASGGINPYAVEHAAAIGGKIVWLPTLSAQNHLDQASGAAATFPKTAMKMMDPIGLTGLDANGEVLDDLKKCLDIIAGADMILAGGHLPAHELIKVFEEARARGVTKMLVNHPTYVVNATDDDIRAMVELGAVMEHSICMFIEGGAKCFDENDLQHVIDVAGVDNTILSSDLGLRGSPRPIEGYRQIVSMLLDLQVSKDDIRTLISTNAAKMLNLD